MAGCQADVLMAVEFQRRQAFIQRCPLAGLAGDEGADGQAIGVEPVRLGFKIVEGQARVGTGIEVVQAVDVVQLGAILLEVFQVFLGQRRRVDLDADDVAVHSQLGCIETVVKADSCNAQLGDSFRIETVHAQAGCRGRRYVGDDVELTLPGRVQDGLQFLAEGCRVRFRDVE